MDFFEEIKKRQGKFLEKPRERIQNLIIEEENFSEGLIKLSVNQNRPDLLILHKEFQKQYSALLGEMLKQRLISGISFKDDLRDISTLQIIEEMRKGVLKHQEKSVLLDEVMLSLKKSYPSILEILWNKLKRIVFLAGLNSKEEHLTLGQLNKKVELLEKQFSLDLSLIKSILIGELRNCIQHEHTSFIGPNFLVFSKEVNGKWEEFFRINDTDLIEELLKLFLILTTLHQVETMVIVSQVEPLLKLNDKQLDEYCKTGILTREMEDKTKNN